MLKNAIKFIWYDKPKMFGILAGILIALFLVGQQLGIFLSMMNGMRGIAKYSPESVWVMHAETKTANTLKTLDNRVGRELYSIYGISEIHPIVSAGGTMELNDKSKHTLNLLGLQGPNFPKGFLKMMEGVDPSVLMHEGAILLDISDKQVLNGIEKQDYFSVNDRRMFVGGFTTGNSGFGATNAVTSIERARALGGISTNESHLFIVEIDSLKTSESAAIKQIEMAIPNVKAMTGGDFGQATLTDMMATSNIAMSFGIMIIFAFITGVVIVGLTLYSSVNDRIKDYGTIKAIGGSNWMIRKMVLTQSVIYAIVGFLISYGCLLAFKIGLSGGKLEVILDTPLVIGLFFMSLIISLIGSWTALRKITKLEPVEIFRM